MNDLYTNEIDLGDEQTEKLLKLLRLVEQAENPQQAVWLQPQSRKLVGNIREQIEDQTGRAELSQ